MWIFLGLVRIPDRSPRQVVASLLWRDDELKFLLVNSPVACMFSLVGPGDLASSCAFPGVAVWREAFSRLLLGAGPDRSVSSGVYEPSYHRAHPATRRAG